eukprot:scaffold366176_cov28-Prasinocladus_malaysianus.AAC.1
MDPYADGGAEQYANEYEYEYPRDPYEGIDDPDGGQADSTPPNADASPPPNADASPTPDNAEA